MVEFRAERSAVVSILLLAIASAASAGVGVWTTTGPAASVIGVAIDRQVPLTVIAAGKPLSGGPNAVFTMRDNGRWMEQAEASTGVVITSLAASPSDPATFYVSAEVDQGGERSGALYVSHDTGESWSFLYLFQDSPLSVVAVDPRNPELVYAGGTLLGSYPPSAVVWTSSDSGRSWRYSRVPGQEFFSMAIDPQYPNQIYVGTNVGLLSSSDSGLSWTFRYQERPPEAYENVPSVTAVAVSPFDSQTLYISTHAQISGFFSVADVLVTRDGGHLWTKTNLGTANCFAFDSSDPNTVYAGSYGVLASSVGGTGWTTIGNLGDYVSAIAIDPSTETIYAAGSNGVSEYRKPPSSWTLVPNNHRTHEVSVRP